MARGIIPKTKKECFAPLDEMLSDEDKRAITEMEDVFQLHFTLGPWIRNIGSIRKARRRERPC